MINNKFNSILILKLKFIFDIYFYDIEIFENINRINGITHDFSKIKIKRNPGQSKM